MAASLNLPVVVGHVGKHISTFQSQLDVEDIIMVLGHDPRSPWAKLAPDLRELYQYLQRATSPKRRQNMSEYIRSRTSPEARVVGAIPAVAIAMTKHQRVTRVQGHRDLGVMDLDTSAANLRPVLDGLARLTSLLELHAKGEDVNSWLSVPVTLFTPSQKGGTLTNKELGQLFHDFNFTGTVLPAAHAIALDTSDLYIQFTEALGQSDVIRGLGGMEARANSLGTKSTAMVVQRNLLKFVAGALEGKQFQLQKMTTPAPKNANLTEENFSALLEQIVQGLDIVCANWNRDSVMALGIGWQALGQVFHEVMFGEGARPEMRQQRFRKVASRDWSRDNADLMSKIGSMVFDKRAGKEVYKIAARRQTYEALAGWALSA